MLFYLTYWFRYPVVCQAKWTWRDASIALYYANIFDRMLAVSEVNSNQSIFSLMYRDEAFDAIIITVDVCIIIRDLLVQFTSVVCHRVSKITLIDNKLNVIKFYKNANYAELIVHALNGANHTMALLMK